MGMSFDVPASLCLVLGRQEAQSQSLARCAFKPQAVSLVWTLGYVTQRDAADCALLGLLLCRTIALAGYWGQMLCLNM
jgi:hypothetical protein